jgi:hypothetical protein
VAVALADAVVAARPDVLVVLIVPRRVAERLHVCWDVRGEGFAADVLQVVCRLVTPGPVGRVLFVVAVVTVGPVLQRAEHLDDSADVDDQERTQGQCPGGRDRAGGGAAQVRLVAAALEHRDDFVERDLAQ